MVQPFTFGNVWVMSSHTIRHITMAGPRASWGWMGSGYPGGLVTPLGSVKTFTNWWYSLSPTYVCAWPPPPTHPPTPTPTPPHWSPISLVPFPLVPQFISPHYIFNSLASFSLVPLFISPPIFGQSQWAPISLVPHLIGPPSHGSSTSLVPQLAPKHHPLHWSPITLVPHPIGLPSHWTPFSLASQFPYYTVWTHWCPFP